MSVTDAFLTWLQASAALALALLALPYTPYVAGALAGGVAMGMAKNKTALAEIVRGVSIGLVAGLLVWAAQALLIGGAA